MPRGLMCWRRGGATNVADEPVAIEDETVVRTSSNSQRILSRRRRFREVPQYHDILAKSNLKQKSITERTAATTFDSKLKTVGAPAVTIKPKTKPALPRTHVRPNASDDDNSGSAARSSTPSHDAGPAVPIDVSPARPTSIVHRQEVHKFGVSGWGSQSLYYGEESDGQRNGQGRETWPNGIFYSGSWKNNNRHGLGEWHDPNSRQKYIGQWRDGSRHGWGVFETDHIRYEGYWVKNMISGKGECVYLSHSPGTQSYSGSWFMGFRDGEGVFRFANNCVYDGEWVEDNPSGRGVFRWPSGIQLEATWTRGKPEPCGVFSTANGMLYEGLDYAEVVSRHSDFSHGDTCGWAGELLDLFTEFVASRAPRSPTAMVPVFDPREGLLAPPPIERWAKVSLVGRGAFGCVYKCLNSDTGSFFVMKQVNLQLGNTRQTKETLALEREVALLQKLRHKNIVRYYGTDRSDENDLCVMMEFVAGGDCATILKELKSGFPLHVTKRYSADVCRGTAYLHSEGICHRDIKGGNVLVSVRGVCKLADFGVAAFFDQISGSVRGTPYYLSPEMIRGEASTEMMVMKSDVWSIGCTVFEFATANPPWRLEFGTAPFYFVVGQIKPTDAVPLSIPEDVSPDLAIFIRKAMSPDPKNRPTAEEMLLDPFLECQDTEQSRSSPLPRQGEMAGMRSREGSTRSSNMLTDSVRSNDGKSDNGESPASRASTCPPAPPPRASKAQQDLGAISIPPAPAVEKADAGPTRANKTTSIVRAASDLRFKCVMDGGGDTKVFALALPASYTELTRQIQNAFGVVRIAFVNGAHRHVIESPDDLARVIDMHHADSTRKGSVKLTLTKKEKDSLKSFGGSSHAVTLVGDDSCGTGQKNSLV